MTRRRASFAMAILFLAFGTWQIASAGWIHAKALLAQRLIASAWSEGRETGDTPRPWPWADLKPVGRLRVAARGIDLYVLDHASLRSLAFGPALMGGSAPPGAAGNTVLVAHRDTHFAFLARLEVGDEIEVEGARGMRGRYRVSEVAIVDRAEARVLEEDGTPQLTLITCYPFDAVIPGTRLRYVVVADRVPSRTFS